MDGRMGSFNKSSASRRATGGGAPVARHGRPWPGWGVPAAASPACSEELSSRPQAPVASCQSPVAALVAPAQRENVCETGTAGVWKVGVWAGATPARAPHTSAGGMTAARSEGEGRNCVGGDLSPHRWRMPAAYHQPSISQHSLVAQQTRTIVSKPSAGDVDNSETADNGWRVTGDGHSGLVHRRLDQLPSRPALEAYLSLPSSLVRSDGGGGHGGPRRRECHSKPRWGVRLKHKKGAQSTESEAEAEAEAEEDRGGGWLEAMCCRGEWILWACVQPRPPTVSPRTELLLFILRDLSQPSGLSRNDKTSLTLSPFVTDGPFLVPAHPAGTNLENPQRCQPGASDPKQGVKPQQSPRETKES
ncbi:hypothetical protein EDB80DRAFT_688910 [Ilyonectria destructans]|nr:hypothetical protein EDB80DRAFT_688910 [Ilyonectria destructans]